MGTLSSIRNAAIEDAGAGGLTVYTTKEDLPTSNLTEGDQAYVSGNSRLYISNGSGWYNVALINATPTLTISPSGAIELSAEGTNTVITLTGNDSDNAVDGLTFSVESDGSFAGLGTLSQDSSVFTITPLSEDSATTTSSTLTFKASDGINFGSGTSVLSLTFIVANSNYTTLLLQADSDGTDNQVDASTNAFAVTEYGNVTSTVFSPYHPGGYSTYFDGSGDNITASNIAISGDCTFEFWMYQDVAQSASYRCVLAASTYGSGTPFTLYTYGSNVTPWLSSSGGPHISGAFTAHTWHHIALVRNSGTWTLYIDGTSAGTSTTGGSYDFAATTDWRFGENHSGSYDWQGYIKDARIVNGTAVYTSSFTPPTAPLTAITNTSLLTCNLPYIADGSSNDHTITIAGNTSTKRFGLYDYLPYTKADHGGSVYFDGTGDYIQTPNGTYMDYGSGDFTFEAWIYPTASNGDRHIASDYASSGQMTSGSFHTLIDDGILKTYVRAGGVNIIGGLNGTTTIQLNVWHHVALVRNGNVFTLYLNGASEASTTQSGAMNVSSQPFTIGRAGQYAGALFQGYISNARLVKGTAVYTSAFTPPTAPLTAITNTELLTCTNKNDIWDTGQGTRLLKSGNVTASNTQRKFISSSAVSFDGSGDSISFTAGYDDPLYNFGTHDWTLEGWFYIQTLSGGRNLFSFLRASANEATPHVYTQNTDLRYYVLGADRISGSSALTVNTWHHIAATRSGNDHKLFVDGTQVGSTWTNAQTYVQGRPVLGDYHTSLGNLTGGSNLLHGYAQDFRITKGLARYTGAFTPPTEEFKG